MDKYRLYATSKTKVTVGSIMFWQYQIGSTVVRRVFAGMVKTGTIVEEVILDERMAN